MADVIRCWGEKEASTLDRTLEIEKMKVIEVKKFKEVLMKIIEKRKVQELLMLIEKKIEEQNEAWRAEILQILGELTTDNTVGPEASATGSNSADTAKEVEK